MNWKVFFEEEERIAWFFGGRDYQIVYLPYGGCGTPIYIKRT